jgi:hypothetical protein
MLHQILKLFKLMKYFLKNFNFRRINTEVLYPKNLSQHIAVAIAALRLSAPPEFGIVICL